MTIQLELRKILDADASRQFLSRNRRRILFDAINRINDLERDNGILRESLARGWEGSCPSRVPSE